MVNPKDTQEEQSAASTDLQVPALDSDYAEAPGQASKRMRDTEGSASDSDGLRPKIKRLSIRAPSPVKQDGKDTSMTDYQTLEAEEGSAREDFPSRIGYAGHGEDRSRFVMRRANTAPQLQWGTTASRFTSDDFGPEQESDHVESDSRPASPNSGNNDSPSSSDERLQQLTLGLGIMFSAASSARQATHEDVQAPSAAESDGDEDEEDAEVENIRLPAGNADYQNVSFRPKEREGHNVGSDDSENGQ